MQMVGIFCCVPLCELDVLFELTAFTPFSSSLVTLQDLAESRRPSLLQMSVQRRNNLWSPSEGKRKPFAACFPKQEIHRNVQTRFLRGQLTGSKAGLAERGGHPRCQDTGCCPSPPESPLHTKNTCSARCASYGAALTVQGSS